MATALLFRLFFASVHMPLERFEVAILGGDEAGECGESEKAVKLFSIAKTWKCKNFSLALMELVKWYLTKTMLLGLSIIFYSAENNTPAKNSFHSSSRCIKLFARATARAAACSRRVRRNGNSYENPLPFARATPLQTYTTTQNEGFIDTEGNIIWIYSLDEKYFHTHRGEKKREAVEERESRVVFSIMGATPNMASWNYVRETLS